MVISSFFEQSGEAAARDTERRTPPHPAVVRALRSVGLIPELIEGLTTCEDLVTLARVHHVRVSEFRSAALLLEQLTGSDTSDKLALVQVARVNTDITLLAAADVFDSLTLIELGSGHLRMGVPCEQFRETLDGEELRRLVLLRRRPSDRAGPG